MNFEIDVPKKEGFGEDAPPINIKSTNSQISVVAVFDGLGGSGSTMYEENESIRTGAYIASREAREAVYQFFNSNIEKEDFQITEPLIIELKNQIKSNLRCKLSLQKFEQSKLKSSLIRTFPTTMVLAVDKKHEEKSEIDVLWAGDSRVYILSPNVGLVQLTKDDLKLDNDPFDNIENDSPLSNMIHLDNDFEINHKKIECEYPHFIIAVTDGCFGYYSTPMHFENMLLDNLFKANFNDEWRSKISEDLKIVSGDDFSMSVQYITNNILQFNEVKELFKERKELLSQEYMNEITEIEIKLKKLEQEVQELQEEISQLEKSRKDVNKTLWKRYKEKNYQFFNAINQ